MRLFIGFQALFGIFGHKNAKISSVDKYMDAAKL